MCIIIKSCNFIGQIITTNNNLIHPQLLKFLGNKFNNWYIQMHVWFWSHDFMGFSEQQLQ